MLQVRRTRYVTPTYLAALQANAASGDGGSALNGKARSWRQQQQDLLLQIQRGSDGRGGPGAIPGLGLLSASSASSLVAGLASGLSEGDAEVGVDWVDGEGEEWYEGGYYDENGEWVEDTGGEGEESEEGAGGEGGGGRGRGGGGRGGGGGGRPGGKGKGKGGKGKGGGKGGGGKGGGGRGGGNGGGSDDSDDGSETDDDDDSDGNGGGGGRGGGRGTRRRRKKDGASKKEEKWDPLEKGSIWLPRAKESDSRSLYDTEQVEFMRFKHDWNRVLELGIAKLIIKMDDGTRTSRL